MLSFSPHEIDHTIAEKHGDRTTKVNLALACKLCNTYKGSDIASIDPQTTRSHRSITLDAMCGQSI
jgi:hypothetical protein